MDVRPYDVPASFLERPMPHSSVTVSTVFRSFAKNGKNGRKRRKTAGAGA
jgi:hypothetical protein